jgi:hypothetical protein
MSECEKLAAFCTDLRSGFCYVTGLTRQVLFLLQNDRVLTAVHYRKTGARY